MGALALPVAAKLTVAPEVPREFYGLGLLFSQQMNDQADAIVYGVSYGEPRILPLATWSEADLIVARHIVASTRMPRIL